MHTVLVLIIFFAVLYWFKSQGVLHKSKNITLLIILGACVIVSLLNTIFIK